MGLHAEVRKWLRTVCPEAFRLGFAVNWNDAFLIDDVLTWLRRQYGPRPGGAFKGIELFNRLRTEVWEKFYKGMTLYVCACDIFAFMPSFKGQEQKKRDAQRLESDEDAVPYPDECEISEDGIMRPTGDKEWYPFDIHRVLSNRKVVREKLMRYIDSSFRELNQEIHFGHGIITDYSAEEGPTLITHGYTGPMVLRGGYETQLDVKPRIRRTHGEADHALAFWCRLFRQRRNIIVSTVDTDAILHILGYIVRSIQAIWSAKHLGTITWIYPDKSNGGMDATMQVDMVRVARTVLANEIRRRHGPQACPPGPVNCTLMQLLLACCYTKTDFTEKADFSSGIGADSVLGWFVRHGEIVNKFRVPLGQIRHMDKKKELFPWGDCDPFYVHDKPEWNLRKVVYDEVHWMPTDVCSLIADYAIHADLDQKAMVQVLAECDKGIRDTNQSVEPSYNLYKLLRAMQYFLVDWNQLDVKDDPLDRYIAYEVLGLRGKHKRDQDASEDLNPRAQKRFRL